jgi:purine-binding chemotaxis protein CheW
MVERSGKANQVLIVVIGAGLCALPLDRVIETMRPLPVEAISGAPPFVQGVAIIRGIPTPVVGLEAILGAARRSSAERFVTVRTGNKQVALSVSGIVGIRALAESVTEQNIPPLLTGAAPDAVRALGTLDEQLLMVLQASWKLPEEVWEAMTAAEAVS